ncbi:MAG: hypothetical protein M3Q88_06790 [Pseudomonadota bacterium]|nr:hypothetical protein [Pseudomonadota bacterium]
MKSTAIRPAIEIAVEWIAAAGLGSAAGFAVARLAAPGTSIAAAVCAGMIVSIAALLILARVDARDSVGSRFEPLGFPADDLGEAVLLLDQPLDEADELLLDDPLPAIDVASRVVRLFAEQPPSRAVAPSHLPGPSEMVARIEDYLGPARGSAAAAEPRRDGQAEAVDASAALHAALAEIRRSLRQG